MLPIDTSMFAAFIVRGEGDRAKLLLLQRSAGSRIMPLSWQILYGHLMEYERAETALRREILEETALVPCRIFSVNETMIFYEHHQRAICIVPVFAAFVKWDADVKISADEHTAYRWVGYQDALSVLTWNQQRRMLNVFWEGFILQDPPDNLKLNGR